MQSYTNETLLLGARASRSAFSMPLLLLMACGGRYELGEVLSTDLSASDGSEASARAKIGRVIIDELGDLDAQLSAGREGSIGDIDGDGYDDWLASPTDDERSALGRGESGYRLVYGGPRVAGDPYREDRFGPLFTYAAHGPPPFLNAPRSAGDLDGDGFGDVLYSASRSAEHLPTGAGQPSGFSPGLWLVEHWDENLAYVQYGGPRAANSSAIRLHEIAVPFAPDEAIQASFGPALALETDADAEGWNLQTSTKLTRLGDLDSDGLDDFAYTFVVAWNGEKVVDDTIVQTSARTDAITQVFYGVANRLSVENPRTDAAAMLPGVTAIDSIGDVNGDGHPDLVAKKNDQIYLMVGSPERLTGSVAPEQRGAALLPADGKLENGWVLQQREAVGVGDLDADGFDDLMVSRWGPSYDDSATYLFYGSAHRFERVLLDESADAVFIQQNHGVGLSVQALGDWNGDGRVDLLVANDDSFAEEGRATAVVIPGRSERYSGVVSTDMLDEAPEGRSLNGALYLRPLGDVDGDGRVDLEVETFGWGRFVKYGRPFESLIH